MMKTYSLNDLQTIAKYIIESASYKTLLFYGEMGVGKTTLIKELVKQLDSDDVVSSPTFSLVNEYQSHDGESIYHFDFYRINNEEEALDIGIDDYFYHNKWCMVEWPEKVKNLLPLNAVALYLTKNEDGTRSITIK
ncbi:MAG: tRNA (adenosine(37)-N6)-threonylcarbamoyltransferase complex ATPase subunit type 1 TsaE [Flavobacteriaceae bacterium]|nr:tRNA (adenosine(37)-N6)-threonylcarbamoyltransferase complex ATPase subunit type 1 TsaE [Flavobacteriaceae bacterium]